MTVQTHVHDEENGGFFLFFQKLIKFWSAKLKFHAKNQNVRGEPVFSSPYHFQIAIFINKI